MLRNPEGALLNAWRSMNVPVPEGNVVDKWYAAIYKDTNKNKSYLYIGKAKKRFLHDAKGPISGILLDCLKPHVGSSNVLETYKEDDHDEAFFPIWDIITRPLALNVIKHDRLEFPHYQDVKTLFNKVVSLDRKALANQIQSNSRYNIF